MEKEKPAFIDISLNILKRFNRPLIFDIYIKRTESDYTKLFNIGDQLDWERLKKYEDKNVTIFYVTAQDYKKYSLYVEKLGSVFRENKKSFTADEAQAIVKEMINLSMHEIIINQNIEESVLNQAANLINDCVGIIATNPKDMIKVVTLMSSKPYIFKHSISTSIFATLLGIASGIQNDKNLSILALGAFLHDVGESQMSFDPEEKNIFTPDERKEIYRHPSLGKQLLEGSKNIKQEVLDIVLQHHEQPNGHGYPNGIRDGEIYHPAKIVAIADTFASLITKRAHREAMTTEEALQAMMSDVGKYDKILLRTFYDFFFPKPKK